MAMKHTLLLSLSLIAASSFRVWATGAVPEKLQYEGKQTAMLCQPLEPYLDTLKERPKEVSGSTLSTCWRGYVGEWRIDGNKLFLVRLGKCLADGYIPLGKIFKNASAPVFASWYSGAIRVGQGKILEDENAGYAYTYESDLMLLVSKGALIGAFTVDNRKDASERVKVFQQAREKFKAAIGADPVLAADFDRQHGWLRKRAGLAEGK
jgi:hypothetical protein